MWLANRGRIRACRLGHWKSSTSSSCWKRSVAAGRASYTARATNDWTAPWRSRCCGRERMPAAPRAAARVKHPNSVQILQVGQVGQQAYLALELLEGGTLAGRMAAGPWSAPAAADLIQTLAHAMHAAHQQGVVHRHLKPENVLFS